MCGRVRLLPQEEVLRFGDWGSQAWDYGSGASGGRVGLHFEVQGSPASGFLGDASFCKQPL